ncbi:6-pyruvoyl trahydropterin synthase family protein [Roseomonas sp. BN140053]|uniref:6-pyruvoyl trahydropterin synthase family protein n=1 Tax=Roseomonas sp. BN140053 TaxID=3391898 RepID=UPI0039EC9239
MKLLSETSRQFSFEAAHQTPPYSGLHGHSFRVEVGVSGEADPVFGWSHNQFDLEVVLDAVKQELDHKYLNDIEGLAVPTLENLTHWIWKRLEKSITGLDRVVVRRGNEGQVEGCSISRQR